ncbi:hypothetical protein ACIGT4_07735 [Streptomyces sioyaensis]
MQLPRQDGSDGDLVPLGPNSLIEREGGGPDMWTRQLGNDPRQDA